MEETLPLVGEPQKESPLPGIFFAAFNLVVAGVLPVYNYETMDFFNINFGHNFALSLLLFQFMGVVILLFVKSILQHSQDIKIDQEASWILGPGFWRKTAHDSKLLIPVAILLSGNVILGNVGLWYASPLLHVLFKGTSILWIILFSSFWKSERPSLHTLLLCVVLVGGEVLVLYSFGLGKNEGKVVHLGLAIFLNLVAALFEGSVSVVLRRVCVKLKAEEHPMRTAEIAFFKLLLCSIIIFIAVCIKEMASWGRVLGSSSGGMAFLIILLGVVITMSFQWSNVGLSKYSKAISSGVVQQWRIVPQILLSILGAHFVSRKDIVSGWSLIVGMILIVLSSIAYGHERWKNHQ